MNSSSKIPSYFISLLLLVFQIGFFYLYAISLKGVLFSLFYFTIVVAVPGFFIFLLFFKFFSNKSDKQIDNHLIVSLSVVLGIANVLFTYIFSRLTGIFSVNYIFIWPCVFVLLKSGRMLLVRSVDILRNNYDHRKVWTGPIIILFTVLFNIYFFAMRPTPGILPVEIFHDHLWNAGNTVSLMSGFPLQSLRIESMPYLSYHILVHVIGAHMAFLTGLTPHLVGLQYVFIPFVPLLIYSMVALLRQFFTGENIYLFYGLAVLLFGGGFHVVHDVKVLNLLGSTNFLGVILLFLFMTIVVNLHFFTSIGRFLLLFTCLFLATVAKGTIGVALCGGVGLWWLFRMYKRKFLGTDITDMLGASIGFLSSYYLFFIWPVLGQQFSNTVVEKGVFPIIPLGYVTNNALMSGVVQLINNSFSGMPQIVVHVVLTFLILPLYLLLYYSYRLFVVYYFKKYHIDEAKKKILIFALSSLMIGYMLNLSYPQDYAYFITVAVFSLDVLFVLFIQREQIFTKIGTSYRGKKIFSFIGIIFVLILPFVDIQNRIRHEHTHNYLFSGKIGQLLGDKLKNTNYRRTMQSITPEMYDALSFIRKSSEMNSIVVSPFVNTPDGRPRAFYASTFSERTAFVEGHFEGRGIVKYADSEEVKEKLDIIDKIFTRYEISDKMKHERYLYVVAVDEEGEFLKRYPITQVYKNNSWVVLQFQK